MDLKYHESNLTFQDSIMVPADNWFFISVAPIFILKISLDLSFYQLVRLYLCRSCGILLSLLFYVLANLNNFDIGTFVQLHTFLQRWARRRFTHFVLYEHFDYQFVSLKTQIYHVDLLSVYLFRAKLCFQLFHPNINFV